jgi:hypothetical protein
MQGPSSKSLYILLGIAGALVGAKIAVALEFLFPRLWLGDRSDSWSAVFVIGWRQLEPP